MMQLAHALRLTAPGGKPLAPPRVAFTGAGGKTTALFRLARELAAGPWKTVLVTATTHLAVEQTRLADRHLTFENDDLQALEAAVADPAPPGVILLTGPQVEPERVGGLPEALLQRVRALADARGLPLLVEADGSRRKPLKAPTAHEPVVPDWVELVVVVAGLSGLGQPLNEEWVHRPEQFAALSGLEPGAPISLEALGRVLLHAQGGLKGILDQSRRAVLLNQADTPERQAQASALAQRLLSGYPEVLVAALNPPAGEFAPGDLPDGPVLAVHTPVAGVILAAGRSQRLGRPKQLLDWQGEPFVRRVARTALAAGLDPVLVVTGAYAAEVRQALEGWPVQFIHNPDWEAGQGGSVAAGTRALPERVGAAFFLLSDQPQAPASLLRSLMARHAETLAPLVAPMAGDRRANPVLFDRVTFAELAALSGDTGGRVLFSRYRAEWLPWHDESLLLDVDTEADYRRLLDWVGRRDDG